MTVLLVYNRITPQKCAHIRCHLRPWQLWTRCHAAPPAAARVTCHVSRVVSHSPVSPAAEAGWWCCIFSLTSSYCYPPAFFVAGQARMIHYWPWLGAARQSFAILTSISTMFGRSIKNVCWVDIQPSCRLLKWECLSPNTTIFHSSLI